MAQRKALLTAPRAASPFPACPWPSSSAVLSLPPSPPPSQPRASSLVEASSLRCSRGNVVAAMAMWCSRRTFASATGSWSRGSKGRISSLSFCRALAFSLHRAISSSAGICRGCCSGSYIMLNESRMLESPRLEGPPMGVPHMRFAWVRSPVEFSPHPWGALQPDDPRRALARRAAARRAATRRAAVRRAARRVARRPRRTPVHAPREPHEAPPDGPPHPPVGLTSPPMWDPPHPPVGPTSTPKGDPPQPPCGTHLTPSVGRDPHLTPLWGRGAGPSRPLLSACSSSPCGILSSIHGAYPPMTSS